MVLLFPVPLSNVFIPEEDLPESGHPVSDFQDATLLELILLLPAWAGIALGSLNHCILQLLQFGLNESDVEPNPDMSKGTHHE